MGNKQKKDKNDKNEQEDQLLLESKISKQMVLEHPTYKEMEEKLLQVEQKSQEYWNNWLSIQAELENFKKRTDRDIANAHKYGIEKFAYEILTVVDNLERGLTTEVSNEEMKNFYIGVELTLKSLLEILQKFEISQMDPIGEDFDPAKHTAVTTKDGEGVKPNTVLEVVQKGYWFKDRLLRPAMVVVSK